ncbi:SNO glutamine amidotransferase [Ascodesmis nigricans]|uniref:glutaminase n=1 Tax=Ascodesmis nigricans TaxID=341454 RepID=A0A4S2MU40_9PEZI|nr:SNO glutamine amidotransferase [Ascodesmis nigricans]
MTGPTPITIGVLALQGAYREHLQLLTHASLHLPPSPYTFTFLPIRTSTDLTLCSALIIPGGESTTISLLAASNHLLGPLRDFVKLQKRPTWGTCAGMILLAEQADRTKRGGQELIGGLGVRVRRNAFGRQRESFVVGVEVPWMLAEGEKGEEAFKAVFIRAPVVKCVLDPNSEENGQEGQKEADRGKEEEGEGEAVVVTAPKLETVGRRREKVEILTELPPQKEGDEKRIVAVRQGNVFGTSFHPELTGDWRMHRWWLMTVIEDLATREKGVVGVLPN